MTHTPVWFAVAVLLASAATPAEGQIWKKIKDKAKEKVEQKVEATTDTAVSKGYDAAAGKAKCVVADKACQKQAQEQGKQVVLTDASGAALPAGAAGAQQKAAPAGPNPGEGAWANYDFVPGERVLFKEDFSSDRVGNFPRRFEFVDGNAEVVTWNGGKWLRVADNEATVAIPLPEVLPERFTIEFQMTMPWWGGAIWGGPGDGDPKDHGNTAHKTFIQMGCCEVGLKTPRGGPESITDPRPRFASVLGEKSIDGHLFNVRVQFDGRYGKLYLEDQRVANLPAADWMRGNKIYVRMRPSKENPVMFGNISVNAGGTAMYDALMAKGRFATQGILFDVGSDRIRPESTPTLNEIAEMLKAHAELKLRIEGHTDNTGDPAANQTLSEKRAAAVKAYLTGKGGIDAARLESQGFGPTKPVGTNDTPEGRQANRRVELVKL